MTIIAGYIYARFDASADPAIVLGVGFSTILFYIVVHLVLEMTAYPRSVILIDPPVPVGGR
mgnify:CR=1 FL=1